MAEEFVKISQEVLTAGASPVAVASGSVEGTIVRHMRVANNSSDDTTLAMWQGGTTDAEMILPPAMITEGGWAEFEGSIILNGADTLYAAAGAGADLTITVYGLEMS